MDSKEVEKKKSTGLFVGLVAFLILIICIVIVVMNLFTEKTTYITNEDGNVKTVSLICVTKSKSVSDAFFDVMDSVSSMQEMKVIFKNSKINDVAYTATIKYADDVLAVRREADFHAKYGLYMQNNGRDMNDFSPNFSVDATEVKISLFANVKQLNRAFAKIFLIDADSSILSNYTPDVLSGIYSNKGFDCKIND